MENNTNTMLFEYNEKQVRTVDIDGEIWFVSMDIEQHSGHRNIRATINKVLDSDEVGNVMIEDKTGRLHQTNIINESGLYKLLFRSNLPQAKEFTKHVTSVILPTIRKTGNYNANTKYMYEFVQDESEIKLLTEKKSEINKRLRFLKIRHEANKDIIFQPYKTATLKVLDSNQKTLFD